MSSRWYRRVPHHAAPQPRELYTLPRISGFYAEAVNQNENGFSLIHTCSFEKRCSRYFCRTILKMETNPFINSYYNCMYCYQVLFNPSCHPCPTRRRNRVFSNVETRNWRKPVQFAYNLADVNQKLGFSVIGSNLDYLRNSPGMRDPG